MAQETLPLVSVVIPMYNAEKYVGAALTSILEQTFVDYEVIVCNDGSTDNSLAVVQNFLSRFNGRLKVIDGEKNSGGPGRPSNMGVAMASGKYVLVMDSDDLILPNTLGELYALAEKFQAEVVYTDRGYNFADNPDNPFPADHELTLRARQQGTLVQEPVLEPTDDFCLLDKFLRVEIGWPAWEKLVQRKWLIENNITFVEDMATSGDILWTLQLVCHAKRFLRVPNACYLYRQTPNSLCHKKRTPAETVAYWSNVNLRGLSFIEKYLNQQDFVKEDPKYLWAALVMFDGIHFNIMKDAVADLPPHEVYGILKEVAKQRLGMQETLLPYLCTILSWTKYQWLTSTNG